MFFFGQNRNILQSFSNSKYSNKSSLRKSFLSGSENRKYLSQELTFNVVVHYFKFITKTSVVRLIFPMSVLLYIDVNHWRRLSIYLASYLFLFLFVHNQEVSFQFCFLRKVSVNTFNKVGKCTSYLHCKYLSKTRYLSF